MFSKVLYKVMSDENKKKFDLQNFKNKKLVGFPWQKYELRYEPEAWWANAQKIFNQIYLELGLEKNEALEYTLKIKKEFLNTNDFKLYSDSIEVLKYFKHMGYKNIILSNHIPELDIIVNKLGIGKYISECISSGKIGYEKPNPNIFKYVLDKYKDVYSEIWMVGDSVLVDIRGAELMNIKAILVRAAKKEYMRRLLELL